MVGYDSGVHCLGDKYLVVSTDPCAGVPNEWFGWLLINYAASDVALSGAKPQFCTITLLGPRPTDPQVFQDLMKQTCSAADELDIAIVRGHTGIYDSLNDLLGVCTVYGTVEPDQLITSGGAKAGDLIMCTKPLGHETITNYSIAHKKQAQELFGFKRQRQLSELVAMQSCVKEALRLAMIDGVDAMHDATEGGFVSALNELAEASNVGLKIIWEKIPIPQEVLSVQTYFKLSDKQVLAMSSTGTIIAAIRPDAKKAVTAALKESGLEPAFIGEFIDNKDRILIKNLKTVVFPDQAEDPYTMMLASTS